ncbi:hypothetical protein BU16DRAFT_468495 [Lophium mytilinum]|uniref:Uncharacterized protein n=1 Tax=Lophium mytilinum TaxID=390894 RepID=A0A6A6QHZ6_9PEZI|nr:hypothetical protein BU16DRAFT_468495 [Lophium mytilinum]
MATGLVANPDNDVYTGIWINRSFGSIYGATLTLDRQSGGLLIAFLALYVGTTGRSFWKLVSSSLHHIYSSPAASDGIYHQRQAVLRNSQSAPDAAITLILASVAWRERAQRIWRRTLPVLVVSLIVAATFATAGILSSRVTTKTANEVLMSGKFCENFTKSEDDIPLLSNQAPKLTNYLSYALQCYRRTDQSRSTKCQTFVKPELAYTVDSNASCPFSDEMCVSKYQNLFLDTGYLDSINDLGVNQGPRFLVRSTRHCAPLVTRGYSRLHTDQQNPSLHFMRYYYGRATLSQPAGDEDQFIYEVQLNTSLPYSSSTIPSLRHLFSPIPQLNRSDARLSLLFLESSGILYMDKTDDPWFAATTLGTMNADIREENPGLDQYFVANEPAGVLGCATQRFYCNPELQDGKRCVISLEQSNLDLLSELWPDEKEQAILGGTIAPIHVGTSAYPETFYVGAGLPVLLTRFTLLGPWQTNPIPSNRWQQEMEHSFQATLASLQSSLVEDAMGDMLVGGDICTESEPRCIKKCKTQKIKSSRYYSFSILGMSIILCVGGFIMLLALFLKDVAKLMNKIRGLQNSKSAYATLEWQANSTLQLQRIAHESLGLGTWSKTAESIPVTEKNQILGVLDITRNHPRLVSAHHTINQDVDDETPNIRSEDSAKSPLIRVEEHLPSASLSSSDSVRSRHYRDFRYSSDIELSNMDLNQPPRTRF